MIGWIIICKNCKRSIYEDLDLTTITDRNRCPCENSNILMAISRRKYD